MMLDLVWGCAGPPLHGDHQGVDILKGRRTRSIAAVMVLALAVAGLYSTAASAASKYQLRFVDPPGPESRQPQDAEVGDTIRAADLSDAAAFVQVEVVDATTGVRVTSIKQPVGFKLQTGAGFAGGTLSVSPRPLVNGVAEFGLGTLSIGTENEPQFTDYALVPVTTRGALITGPASEGFDVWEDGESCAGGTDTCVANLRNHRDTYTLAAAGSLGASELPGALPGLSCPGQDEIFSGTVFSYATTGAAPLAPVFLSNHITKADWKASANNGQAHAEWCIGLVSPGAWSASGAVPTQQDTDLDGDLDLWVAAAPPCPQANPSASAPCIVSQTGDGAGGSITRGWLPGGDPPRRT
jgi:hypothetical protein